MPEYASSKVNRPIPICELSFWGHTVLLIMIRCKGNHQVKLLLCNTHIKRYALKMPLITKNSTIIWASKLTAFVALTEAGQFRIAFSHAIESAYIVSWQWS